MSDPIRVGLIRCDTHGAYYAALMAAHDPLLLQRPVPFEQPARYSWMHGGAHFYFYTQYSDPRQLSVDAVDGFALTRVWDQHRDAAACLARICGGEARVCDSFEEVSDGVDLVFVADCNGEGEDHLDLARPGLEKGVPTFVDKPLAKSYGQARAMLDLGQQHGAPVASLSILRTLPHAGRFARRLDEVGEVQFGSVQGGGTSLAGHIHAVSLAQHIFGGGIETVRSMGETPLQTVHLDYGGRADRPGRGVALNCDVGAVWHCAFHASAYGPAGAIHSPPLSDFDFPFGAAEILRQLRHMVHSGESPPLTGDMLEGVAVCEAARLAQEEGRAVRVEEVGYK